MKAAIKESPANWAGYTPGVGIPDRDGERHHAQRQHDRDQPEEGLQPVLVHPGPVRVAPANARHAWARASANGPILNFTNPANATKIYNYLAAQSKSVGTYATNPLWQTVDGPYKLTSFNSTTEAFTMSRTPPTAVRTRRSS